MNLIERLRSTSAALFGCLVVLSTSTAAQGLPLGSESFDFKGRALVAISDADMVASAYVDGLLGPRAARDAFSVIPLTKGKALRAHSTEVTNSVAGAPAALAVSPDGRYAFVAETFGQATSTMQRFSELMPGSALTVLDISNMQSPRVIQRLEIGKRLETVEINPAGDMLLVGLNPADGRGVAFIPFQNGQLGTPRYSLLPGVEKSTRITHVSWHPSGRFIAAALSDVGRVAFAQVQRDGDAVTLLPWGNSVLVGKYPFKVVWTPDGRHVLANNLQWGPDVIGFWTEAPRGSVVSVRFADTATTNPQGQAVIAHAMVSVAEVGVSPEGLVISPDAKLVVTTNLERSYLPDGDARRTRHASLSMLTLDAQTGRLQRVGEYPFDGVLPESAVFDASSRYLAVTNFDQVDRTRDAPSGSIDFWRVDSDPLNPGPLLVRTAHRVHVTRGPHTLVLIP